MGQARTRLEQSQGHVGQTLVQGLGEVAWGLGQARLELRWCEWNLFIFDGNPSTEYAAKYVFNGDQQFTMIPNNNNLQLIHIKYENFN